MHVPPPPIPSSEIWPSSQEDFAGAGNVTNSFLVGLVSSHMSAMKGKSTRRQLVGEANRRRHPKIRVLSLLLLRPCWGGAAKT